MGNGGKGGDGGKRSLPPEGGTDPREGAKRHSCVCEFVSPFFCGELQKGLADIITSSGTRQGSPNELIEVFNVVNTQLLLPLLWQLGVIGVEKLLAVEWLRPTINALSI